MTAGRLPVPFWALWTGFLINRFGLLTPAFLTLYLTGESVATAEQAGLAIAALGFGTIGGGLLGGVLADRTGPRRTLWTSQALVGLVNVAFMVVRSPALMVVLALAMGLFNGLTRSAVYGLAAYLTAAEQRARAFGHMYWAINVGVAVTMLTFGLLLEWWPPAIFVPGAVGAAAYAAIALAVPEAPVQPRRSGVVTDLVRPFRAACVGPFLVLAFVLSAIGTQRHSTVPLEMHNAGLSYRQVGFVLAFGAVLVIVLQPFAANVVGRFRPVHAFVAATALIAVGFGLNLGAAEPSRFGLAVTVWTCGEIMLIPLSLAFISDHAPPNHASSYHGAFAFAWMLGFAVGAPAGQFALVEIGSTFLWTTTAALGFPIAVGYLLLARRCRWLAGPRGVLTGPGDDRGDIGSKSRLDDRQECSMTVTSVKHLREVDRVPDGESAQAAPLDLGPLLGVWRAANHLTWGITEVELSERDGRVWARAWAADPRAGVTRDWGEVPVDGVYADGPLSSTVCGYRATFDLGHARTQLQANMLHSVMVCGAITTFTDGSGRANYFSREFLHRRG